MEIMEELNLLEKEERASSNLFYCDEEEVLAFCHAQLSSKISVIRLEELDDVHFFIYK